MFPGISMNRITEAFSLAKRAVEALERQAELMAEPEPEEKTELTEGEAKAHFFNGSASGKLQVAQELEGILNVGYEQAIAARKLRDLVLKYAPTKIMKDKK